MWGLRLPTVLPAKYNTEDICGIIDDFIYKKEIYSVSNTRFSAIFLDMLCKIDQCSRKFDTIKYPREKVYTEQAKKYINSNIYNPITQKQLADYLGISPGYLCSIFKKNEGITVMKYINDIKLKSIKSLMEKENIYLYEAAALHGYDDANYVSRLFKKTYGYNITDL